jgi:nitric oxide reductase subunit B
MVLISLLPVGLLQTKASVEIGYWYARSPEFLQTPLMSTLRWLRAIGDTIFACGAFAFAWFAASLLRKRPHSPVAAAGGNGELISAPTAAED